MRLPFVRIGIALIALAAFLAPSMTMAAATDDTKKVCLLKVRGMSCGSCVSAVKKAATKVDGVKDATVSLEKGQAEVAYDPAKTTPDDIAKAITKAGFKSEVKE